MRVSVRLVFSGGGGKLKFWLDMFVVVVVMVFLVGLRFGVLFFKVSVGFVFGSGGDDVSVVVVIVFTVVVVMLI